MYINGGHTNISNITLETLNTAFNQIGQLHGMRVFVDDIACVRLKLEQYRFPKRRNRRIQKRWANNKKNFRHKREEYCYKTPFGIIMSRNAFMALNPMEVQNGYHRKWQIGL